MSQAKTPTAKELKVFSRPVVTHEDVKKDKRKLTLLHIIKLIGEISERGLTTLLYILKKEKNVDIGYNFILIGEIPNSKELLEDIRVLLYLGILETNPITRKLRLTSTGTEFLESNKLPKEEVSKLEEYINEVKPRVLTEETTTEMLLRGIRARRRGHRRR